MSAKKTKTTSKPAAAKAKNGKRAAEGPAKKTAKPATKAKAPPAGSGGIAPRGRAAPRFKSPDEVRLLVVDDEPEVLNLLVPFLRKKGYSVSEAEDGDQALEKILTERPNVVLLDVMMPGLNGWEISQYVRDRPELDPVRIIMATGIGEEMNAATAPLYGADAYIDKPFRLDEVEKTVKDVLDRIESGAI